MHLHWYSMRFIDIHEISMISSTIHWISCQWYSMYFFWLSMNFIDILMQFIEFVNENQSISLVINASSFIFNKPHWHSITCIEYQWYLENFLHIKYNPLSINGIQWISFIFNDFHWSYNECQWVALLFNKLLWYSMNFNVIKWILFKLQWNELNFYQKITTFRLKIKTNWKDEQ